MAITAGGSLNAVAAPSKATLSSNYIDFTDASADWSQQYLPDLMAQEVERYGKRTVSGFLSQVGAEEASSSDRVVWSEQGRLHLFETGQLQTLVYLQQQVQEHTLFVLEQQLSLVITQTLYFQDMYQLQLLIKQHLQFYLMRLLLLVLFLECQRILIQLLIRQHVSFMVLNSKKVVQVWVLTRRKLMSILLLNHNINLSKIK